MVLESDITIVDELDLPEAYIMKRSDGLYHLHFKKDVIYDVSLQLRLTHKLAEFTNGKKGKFIFSADEGFIFTREARDNAEHAHHNSPIAYYALVVNNLAYKIIANFYVKVVKRKGLFRIVSSVREGAEWLHSLPDQ